MSSSAGRAMSSSPAPSSFQHYQRSVDDAWDAGDDDEFCVVSAGTTTSTAAGNDYRVHISSSLANKTALSVISSHKQLSSRCAPTTTTTNNIETNNSVSCAVHHGGKAHVEGGGAARRNVVSQAGKTEAMQRLAAQRCISSSHGTVSPCATCPSSPAALAASRRNSQPLPPPVRYHKHKANAGLCQEAVRLAKLREAVGGGSGGGSQCTSLAELRALCWGGVPQPVRAVCWRLLSGYVPLATARRDETLRRRRAEYWSFVTHYYDTRQHDTHQDTYRQIHIDIPRMSPLIPLFQQRCVQEMFERILFIWAIRHPASGYVQGMNDLVTPYFIVFLQEVLPSDADVDQCQLDEVEASSRRDVEADTFWSMSRLLEGIQDNYTFAQPGIQNKVAALAALVHKTDAPLHAHIAGHGIDYLQFAFRWMNNVLMRELPLHCTIRLWDTYLSEEDGFASFHLYVCAAFLAHWSRLLMAQRDFQGLMLTLQNLPTHEWTNREISLLVAEAYRLKFTYADAPGHLGGNK